jgi:prepilin-type N-terminal cleavage/methylation domain
MIAKIINKKGMTIIELIVSLAIITIFFISLTQLLAVASRIYLYEVQAGNSEVMLETVADDIKGYIRFGTDIRVMYVTQADDDPIPGTGGMTQEKGSEIFQNPLDPEEWICRKPDGVEGEIVLAYPEDFYGNGIDLGFKKIYLAQDEYSFIRGLSYNRPYYRGLNINMQIRHQGQEDPNRMGIYVVDLTGDAVVGRVHVKSSVAVTGLNMN